MKINKKKTAIIASCVAAVTIVGGVAANAFFSSKIPAESVINAVSEATVTKGDISNTVSGTGTLTLEGDTSIKIPSGITIEETKVKSGQEVKAGDTLATVNMRSVYSAIETIQSRISTLDEKITEAQNNTSATSVTAGVSGTVTKIYAAVDDDVYSCISENGSLMEITTSDGNVIKVISTGGTVKSIPVSEGSAVSSSTTVLTVLAGSSDASYKGYIAEREDLTDQLEELLKIESSGAITAPQDGIVADVNVSSSSSGSSSTTGTSAATYTSAMASTTAYTTSAGTASTTAYAGISAKDSNSTAVLLSDINTDEEPSDSDSDDAKLSFSIVSAERSTAGSLGILTPAKGQKVMTEISSEDNSYTGTISWTPQSESFSADTVYQANVKLTAQDGYCFASDSILSIESGIISGIQVSDDGKSISFTISYPAYSDGSDAEKDSGSQNTPDDTETEKKYDAYNNNDTESNNNTENNNNSGNIDYSAGGFDISSSGADAGSYVISGGSSSALDTGSTGSTSTDTSSTSSMVTAFTLSTQGTLSVSVSVDELDINSMSIGQEATITLDAIEDQSFTGTVSSIADSSSSSSNGVAKYTVELTLQKDDNMKIGMNASVSIVTSESKDVLTIPVAALQERGDESYVYTKMDENGNLSGEVTVTTGLSDGTNVEITDGLDEGTTIYYQKSEGSDSDSAFGDFNMEDMGDFQFDDGNGGGAPQGDAPSGGAPSGGGQS